MSHYPLPAVNPCPSLLTLSQQIWALCLCKEMHVILFCQVTVFETVSLGVSRDAILVQDHAFSGGVDLCRVQTTHTGNTAYK